jgi:hypothetical protein
MQLRAYSEGIIGSEDYRQSSRWNMPRTCGGHVLPALGNDELTETAAVGWARARWWQRHVVEIVDEFIRLASSTLMTHDDDGYLWRGAS